MAVTVINPYPVANDMMEIDDIVDQLQATGHPVTSKLVKAWIKAEDLYTERYRGDVYVSFSDILMAHKEWVAGKP